MSAAARPRVKISAFQEDDLPEMVEFWNRAFAERRNFAPITAGEFRARVLASPAFEAGGLLFAWQEGSGGREMVGLVHAFRPPPAAGLYLAWPRKHDIALLYVRPDSRRLGVGTRLLHAAEEWLHYCPVYFSSVGQPAYGCVEGPRPPFFGSSEHLALSARDTALLHFLRKRGYTPFEPGSISMTLRFESGTAQTGDAPLPQAATQAGLRPVFFSDMAPFTGVEPSNRLHYLLLGANDSLPYCAIGLVNAGGELVAHLSWFPLRDPSERRAAISNVRVALELRGLGLGTWLLDQALHLIRSANAPAGGYAAVELNTHSTHFARAVEMYERRGFVIDDLWVTLVKT